MNMKIPPKTVDHEGILYTYTYASALSHLPSFIFPLKGKWGLGTSNQWQLITV